MLILGSGLRDPASADGRAGTAFVVIPELDVMRGDQPRAPQGRLRPRWSPSLGKCLSEEPEKDPGSGGRYGQEPIAAEAQAHVGERAAVLMIPPPA
jgi:hypothetical protein